MTHPQDRGARRRINRQRPDTYLSRSQRIDRYGVEKQWKHLYGRSVKLRRAQQLGKLWPRREWEKLMAEAEWDEKLLNELSQAMTDASICGLGQAAANPLKMVLAHFADDIICK